MIDLYHLIMSKLEIILEAVTICFNMALQILNKCMHISVKANGTNDLIILCISWVWMQALVDNH